MSIEIQLIGTLKSINENAVFFWHLLFQRNKLILEFNCQNISKEKEVQCKPRQ